MDCCASIIKIILGLLNFVFLVLGLLLIVVGCIGLAGDKAIQAGFTVGIKTAGDFSSSSNETLNSPYAQEGMKGISELLKKGALPILIIGLIICIIAVSGMFGVCCESKGLLIIYLVALCILLIAEIVFISLYLSGKVEKILRTSLKKTITEDYVSFKSLQPVSAAWTMIMIEFQCCGVHDYLDFKGAKKWKRNPELKHNGSASTKVQLVTPLACCKVNNTEDYQQMHSYDCAENPTYTTSNFKKGCYNSFKQKMGNYVIIFSFAILLLQLFLIGLAAYMIRETDKELKI